MSQAQLSMEMTTPENSIRGDREFLDDMDDGDHDIDLNDDFEMNEDYAGVGSSITYSATLNTQKVVNENDRYTLYKSGSGMEVPAVFHDQIRLELIAEAKEGGAYTHKPRGGTEAADTTAFHADQRHWEESGAGRPELLKSFAKPQNFSNPQYKPGFMYFDGFLVVDHKCQPLKAFRGIPLTLSSKLEGWRAEAIRRADPRIRNMDLLARMPVKVEPSANGIPTRQPVVKENAVAGRQSRFRETAGAVTWGGGGAANAYNFLWALLPQYCKDNNLALPRDLTQQEKGRLLSLNVGKKPERARKAKTDKGMTREEYIDGVHARAAGQQKPRGGNPRRLRKEIIRGARREATAETQPESSASLSAEMELAEDDAALPDSPRSSLAHKQVAYQTVPIAPAVFAAPAAPVASVVPVVFPTLSAPVASAVLPVPSTPVASAVFATPTTLANSIALAAPVTFTAPITVMVTVAIPAPAVPAPVATTPLLPPGPRIPARLIRGRGRIHPPFPFVRPGEYLLDESRKFF